MFWSIHFWFTLLACTDNSKPSDTGTTTLQETPPTPEPALSLPTPNLRRLTTAQYHNSITHIFGEGLLLPNNLEPDLEYMGLLSLGSTVNAVSPVGVERYEHASYSIASQLIEGAYLNAWLDCDLATADDSCIIQGIENIGRMLWRRSLEQEESEGLYSLYQNIQSQSDAPTGFNYSIAAMLQSPHFLYRVENGDAEGVLSSVELASKLSFFLWNAPPDLELLDIAENSDLREPQILQSQVDRMMADAKFQQGTRNFFDEVLHLYELDDLTKDPLVFDHASPDLYLSAKEETFRMIEHVIQNDQDFRNILTTRDTFIDRRLAALYNIPAPSLTGFAQVELPENGQRRGLLGQASMLNLYAHPTSTSATLRGVFIRKVLLCQHIPPPPADVDTSIPAADENSPTLRERLQVHFEDPSCAGCHTLMDLVGLGLENFDGIGRWRNYENDATIDPSGTLDGSDFMNAWDLGEVVKNHPRFGGCMSQHLYAYANGYRFEDDEGYAYQDWLATNFAYEEWSFQSLMRLIALSDSFRHTGVTYE